MKVTSLYDFHLVEHFNSNISDTFAVISNSNTVITITAVVIHVLVLLHLMWH